MATENGRARLYEFPPILHQKDGNGALDARMSAEINMMHRSHPFWNSPGAGSGLCHLAPILMMQAGARRWQKPCEKRLFVQQTPYKHLIGLGWLRLTL